MWSEAFFSWNVPLFGSRGLEEISSVIDPFLEEDPTVGFSV